MTQLAIADPDGTVGLWCDYEGTDENGFIHFFVINGAWRGTFKDNMVHIKYTKEDKPGLLVWVGVAGLKEHGDGKWSRFPDSRYNEAIDWIQEQIDMPGYNALPYEQIEEYKMPVREEDDDDEVPF